MAKIWTVLILLLVLSGVSYATEQFSNNCTSTLAAAITTTTATSASITSAACFPSTGTYSIRIDSELMTVTSISGTTLTVVRNEDGNGVATHALGATVYVIETTRAFNQLKADAAAYTLGSSQPFAFVVSGAPTTAQTWNLPCPYTITFPGNFSGTAPDGNGRATCGTSPTENDTYTISIANAPIGTMQLQTSCISSSGTSGTGVVFATNGGAPQTCAAGQRLAFSTPIQVVGTPTTAAASGGGTQSLTLNTPTGAGIGDVLVACVAYYSNVSGAPPSTLPSGFNYVTGSSTTSCKAAGATGGGSVCMYSDILAAAPAANYTWNWAAGNSYPSAGLMAIRGLNTSTLVDSGVGSASSSTAGANISIPYGATTVPDFLLTCVSTYPATGWSVAPAGQQALVPSNAGFNILMSLSAINIAGGASGNITGTFNDATSVYGGVNIPLEVAYTNAVSGADLGWTVVGHISALP